MLRLSMHPCHRDSSADSHSQPRARCPRRSDLPDSPGRPPQNLFPARILAGLEKGRCLDRWFKLGNALFGGVRVCMSLGSSAAHACAGEETCREEKKGSG